MYGDCLMFDVSNRSWNCPGIERSKQRAMVDDYANPICLLTNWLKPRLPFRSIGVLVHVLPLLSLSPSHRVVQTSAESCRVTAYVVVLSRHTHSLKIKNTTNNMPIITNNTNIFYDTLWFQKNLMIFIIIIIVVVEIHTMNIFIYFYYYYSLQIAWWPLCHVRSVAVGGWTLYYVG